MKTLFLILILFVGCAEKKTRIWIDPPVGIEHPKDARNLYYRMEDSASGKKESLAIPLNEMPQNLVVEEHRDLKDAEGGASATKADEFLTAGKFSQTKDANAPSLSYFRGTNEVESLYKKGQYTEALVKLAPIIEQYPKQVRLFMMQGTLYRKLGETKMAQLSFKRAQELDANNPQIGAALDRTHDELGENQ